MYSSTFSDWFSQAVIDFILGYRTLSVFSEFLSKLQSTDPRDRIRIDKIRAEAIAEAVSRVLSEGERLLSGWTLLAPAELNTRISYKLEEKILLLVSEDRAFHRRGELTESERVFRLYTLSVTTTPLRKWRDFREYLLARC